jgi:predicted PurR-regulated permease PerM
MEWLVVTVIIALFGFVVAVVTPLLKLNTTIVKLMESMNNLSKTLDDFKDKNTESHRRIWEHEEKQDEILSDHETRIKLIEGDK